MCVKALVSKPGPPSRGVWESPGNLEMNGNGWESSLSKQVQPSKSKGVIMLGLAHGDCVRYAVPLPAQP